MFAPLGGRSGGFGFLWFCELEGDKFLDICLLWMRNIN